jgi:hypothetical protein
MYADTYTRQLRKETLVQEREKIRELHQRQQDSLKCLQALETELDKVALDDEEALQGLNDPPQVPTLGLMSVPEGKPSSIKDTNNQTGINFHALALLIQNSDISESETTVIDDEDEHLSLEELARAAKHVQSCWSASRSFNTVSILREKLSPMARSAYTGYISVSVARGKTTSCQPSDPRLHCLRACRLTIYMPSMVHGLLSIRRKILLSWKTLLRLYALLRRLYCWSMAWCHQ